MYYHLDKKDAVKGVMEQKANYSLIKLLKDCKKRHTNLAMAVIDYRTADDMAPIARVVSD